MLCTIAVDFLVFQVVYRHLNMSKKKSNSSSDAPITNQTVLFCFFPLLKCTLQLSSVFRITGEERVRRARGQGSEVALTD